MTSEGCVFCHGAPANDRLMHGGGWLAVLDGHPLTPGHTLVIPRRHVVSLFELDPGEVAEAYEVLDRARIILDGRYHPDGYNIGVNDGRAAGRTVDHLHIHLIPRYRGDVPDPRGGVRNMLPDPSPDLWSVADE